MERFLFKKIELWIVALLVLAFAIFALGFGVIVRGVAIGSDRYGAVGRLAYAVASLPANARQQIAALKAGELSGMALGGNRFGEESGWTFFDPTGAARLDGYLLLSRHDGDLKRHVIDLVDLGTRATVHTVTFDVDALFSDVPKDARHAEVENWTDGRFRPVHPLALANGDLIFKEHQAPMLRATACGDRIWALDKEVFHHTTEIGPDGSFWATTWVGPARVDGLTEDFLDPGLVQFDADGEILYDRSFSELTKWSEKACD